jgi:threonine/homoserine/homoserine lactone efflux protein
MKRYKPQNFLMAIICLISVLVVIIGTSVIPLTVLITLLTNILRITLLAYLMYSIVQMFKASNKGRDGKT